MGFLLIACNGLPPRVLWIDRLGTLPARFAALETGQILLGAAATKSSNVQSALGYSRPAWSKAVWLW